MTTTENRKPNNEKQRPRTWMIWDKNSFTDERDDTEITLCNRESTARDVSGLTYNWRHMNSIWAWDVTEQALRDTGHTNRRTVTVRSILISIAADSRLRVTKAPPYFSSLPISLPWPPLKSHLYHRPGLHGAHFTFFIRTSKFLMVLI